MYIYIFICIYMYKYIFLCVYMHCVYIFFLWTCTGIWHFWDFRQDTSARS